MKNSSLILLVVLCILKINTIAQNQSSDFKFSKQQQKLIITTTKGDKYVGVYHHETDSTVTYFTTQGLLVELKRKNILSVNKLDSSTDPLDKNILPTASKRTIKEYRNLPFLIGTIGGGIWAYTQFKKASDIEKGKEILNNLNINASTTEDASSYYSYGAALSAISVLAFIIAITPTEIEVTDNISFFPSPNNLTIRYSF